MRMIQSIFMFLWADFYFHNNLLNEDYAEKLILNIFSAIENYFNEIFTLINQT